MALFHAGISGKPPSLQAVLDHPWEKAYVAGSPIVWNLEPAFAGIRWLPEEK